MKRIYILSLVFLILTLSACTKSPIIKSEESVQQTNVSTNIENKDQESNIPENTTGKECGVMGLGEKYSGEACDRSCSQKKDCKSTCGCGAINIKENCFDNGIKYDCVDIDSDCIDSKCTSVNKNTNN